MAAIDFDQFDDELRTMQELMEESSTTLSDETLRVPISTLSLRPAVVAKSGTSVAKCVATMVARHFGCLLIVDEDKLVGIFTERDALMQVAGKEKDWAAIRIDELMSPNPAALYMHDTIETALVTMNRGPYRHIAITRQGGQPISVLSVRDIVGYLVDFFPQDILNLPPHPIRVGTKNRHGA